MVALSGIGILAAAAFAHALRAGMASRATGTELIAVGPAKGVALPARCAVPAPARPPQPVSEPEVPAPTGNSIRRLREALGESAEGPDLAASARSPILRALSRHLRAGPRGALPREVSDWAKGA
jgi:hypothetical protein